MGQDFVDIQYCGYRAEQKKQKKQGNSLVEIRVRDRRKKVERKKEKNLQQICKRYYEL